MKVYKKAFYREKRLVPLSFVPLVRGHAAGPGPGSGLHLVGDVFERFLRGADGKRPLRRRL